MSGPIAPAPSLATAFRRAEGIVGRRIGGEYVLVPIVGRGADVEAIFHLNGLGAFIWERLDGRTTGEAIVGAVAEHYDVERARAARDYCEFLGKLESVGAVQAGL